MCYNPLCLEELCLIYLLIHQKDNFDINKTLKIYIDGKLAEGMVSFEVESAELTEKKGELLNGYTFEKTGYKDFLIKLKTRTPIDFSEVFTINVSQKETYEKCRVHKSLRELSKWGNLSFTYIIRAEEVRYEQ